VEFADEELDRLDVDPKFTAGHEKGVIKAYRKLIQMIRAIPDERDLYALKSLHFEIQKRSHQRSMRLNERWRLIVELKGEAPGKKLRIICIEDYHH
jgi:toxin HigB-1